MPAVNSNMIALGASAPDFTLPSTSGEGSISLSQSKGNIGTLVIFICNHCPYVIHCAACISNLAKQYQPKGISFFAISSNDVANYPEDSPQKMAEFAREWDFTFPYLYDESQSVAKSYQAACTPDFYLFDTRLKLFYRGQLDSSRPGGSSPNGQSLKVAMDALIVGGAAPENQLPSIGCSIKWK